MFQSQTTFASLTLGVKEKELPAPLDSSAQSSSSGDQR